MNPDLDALMRKTKTYWYEDGLVELLGGLFFISICAWLLFDWSTPYDAPYKWIFAPGLVAVVFVWLGAARRIVDWLKQRITYPRTGYVAYQRPGHRSRLPRAIMGGVIGGAMAIAIVASLHYRQEIVRAIPILLGGGVAVLLARLGAELGLARFYTLAGWSLAAGIFLAWLTGDMALAIALFYGLLGAAFAVAGAITLVRYLRASPAEAGDE